MHSKIDTDSSGDGKSGGKSLLHAEHEPDVMNRQNSE